MNAWSSADYKWIHCPVESDPTDLQNSDSNKSEQTEKETKQKEESSENLTTNNTSSKSNSDNNKEKNTDKLKKLNSEGTIEVEWDIENDENGQMKIF